MDVHDVKTFKSDPRIAQLLRTGRTIGCFYVESPAMRQLLTKLRCDDYVTLVAASSVIRPGVARSGMMKQYIERHREAFGISDEVLDEDELSGRDGRGRSVLRDQDWFPRRGKVIIRMDKPIVGEGSDWGAAVKLRDASRAAILKHLGEPDLASERPMS